MTQSHWITIKFPDHMTKNDYLQVLPPVLSLELASLLLKLAGPLLKCVRSVVQFRQLLVSLKDFLYIGAHYTNDFVHL